jgi:hypothetical protein
MEYAVNGNVLKYKAEGEVMRGSEEVLLERAIDLTRKTSWWKEGYGIEHLFSPAQYGSFKKQTTNLLLDCWKDAGLQMDDGFILENYHHIAPTLSTHLEAVDKTKLISVDKFPLPIQELEDRISTICKTPVVARNPFDGQRIFHFRVIRPMSADNNPLHRDVWLEDFDDCINLYIPVAGSNEKSSLILIEGSHHWPESKIERTVSGANINGLKFNVPAVTKIFGNYKTVRPSPAENEVLVFSAYLIHGGSVNLNPDKTRISIELRLWKK